MSVFDTVKNIVIENLDIKDESLVTMDATFDEDLGADSLDTVEMVMAMEEEFDIKIDESDMENLKTVGDVVRFIEANK